MATGGPTGALLNPQRVIRSPDQQLGAGDALEMAPQAEIRIPDGQQLRVHGAM